MNSSELLHGHTEIMPNMQMTSTSAGFD